MKESELHRHITKELLNKAELVMPLHTPNKYPIGGFAPGFYNCNCVSCKKQFVGDKRAVQCELCAIELISISAEKKIEETEQRGEMFKQYMEKYNGQNIYNKIALAIEFGYQMCLTKNNL